MKRYKFTTEIHAGDGGGAYVLFPFDGEKEFGTKGRVAVNAKFDGIEYAGSLMKYGHPQHMLGMPKAIREQLGKNPGDTVKVEITHDTAVRTIDVPPELLEAMKRAGVMSVFDGLSFTHRKEYSRWISEAKKEETRANRVAKAVEMLKEGVKTPDGASARKRS